MNKLLTDIIKERRGHYCHCIEVSCTYDIECTIEGVIQGYPGYTEEEYINFSESIQVIYLNEDHEEEGTHDDAAEEEVYNFNMRGYIEGTI